MAKFNVCFSLIAFTVCLVFAQVGFAAPSVKRLGAGNIYKGANSAVNAKSGMAIKPTGTVGRSASIGSIGMGGKIKPMTGTTGATGATHNTNTARLSVGKYLHTAGVNAGIIKPAGSGTPSTAGLDALSARVDDLESQMTTKVDNTTLENNYVTKTEIQNNYYTSEQITNNYATKDSVETITNKVSNLETRLDDVEQATGVVGKATDWCTQGPGWGC